MKAKASSADDVSSPHGSLENPCQTKDPPAGSEITILTAPRTKITSFDRKSKDLGDLLSSANSVLDKWWEIG
jgi:hypothetical protein